MHEDQEQLRDHAEENEFLGFGLETGNLGKSHQDDLVIGVPAENVVFGGEGAIHILYGSDKGLKSKGQDFLSKDSKGVKGEALYDSAFAQTLAIANFGKSDQDDLAIGASRASVDGHMAGEVTVLYGTSTGVTVKGDQVWNQNTSGVLGKVEQVDLIGEGFGGALASGDFGGSRRADLAIGVPYEDVNNIYLAGAVQVLFGSNEGLTAAGDQYLTQAPAGVPSDPSEDDSFGTNLAAADFGRSGRKDLAIDSQDEDVGSAQAAGTVTVLYGSATGADVTAGEVWSQDSTDVEGVAATLDRFGVDIAP